MKHVTLETKTGTSKIRIHRGILGNEKVVKQAIGTERFLIVTNRRLAGLYGKSLLNKWKSLDGYSGIFLIPDSEKAKDISYAFKLYDKLISIGFTRSCRIVAFGGGVCTDLTGYVASTFMRGLSWTAFPTTLLAQIDAAIGGKTAVNHPKGKNLIGTFWHPRQVLIDTEVIKTLSRKQIVNGLAEMIKYGMIADPKILAAIENNTEKILKGEKEPMDDLITRCVRIKSRVVQEDERDNGKRQILNFGHTLGHSLETVTGYGKELHGFSVATGMLFACRLAVHMGICQQSVEKQLETLLKKVGLKSRPISAEPKALIRTMIADKKRKDNESIRFVLPKKIGKVVLVEVDTNVLAKKSDWRFVCR